MLIFGLTSLILKVESECVILMCILEDRFTFQVVVSPVSSLNGLYRLR